MDRTRKQLAHFSISFQMINRIALFSALVVGATEGVVAPNEICLYSEPNLGGQSRCASAGTSGTLCSTGDVGCVDPFPGTVRSIELGAQVTELELYAGANFDGYLATFFDTNLINDLNLDLQGFRSFKAFPFPPSNPPPRAPNANEVCMYTWRHFEGEVVCFPVGTQGTLCSQANGNTCVGPHNEQIRSIRFGPGVTHVELYENANFQTLLYTAETSIIQFAPQHYGITSFKVFGTGGVPSMAPLSSESSSSESESSSSESESSSSESKSSSSESESNKSVDDQGEGQGEGQGESQSEAGNEE